MQKYRKLPVVVEATQFTHGDPHVEGVRWHDESEYMGGEKCYIDTLEGKMCVKPGTWIIRGVAGELYPCDPEIFARTYEAAE